MRPWTTFSFSAGVRPLIQLDTGLGSQLDDRILGEIFTTHTPVRGPLVSHGLLIQIHRRKGQLIEPAQDITIPVHIAHSL